MTKVVHCRKSAYDVYIGRPSIYGNPFSIGKDGTREEVVDKFRVYFYDRIAKDEEFRKAVLLLKDKVLGCWCKPKACHGDIYVEYLDAQEVQPS